MEQSERNIPDAPPPRTTEEISEISSAPTDESQDPGKEDCLLDHMEISIAESEKRTNPSLNIREFFTVYLIETKVTDDIWSGGIPKQNKLSLVWRRYSEFQLIKSHLHSTYPYIILPPLPEKRPMFVWNPDATSGMDITDPDFVDRRRVSLENFLHRISSHPVLCYDSLFLSFLRQESGWRETMNQATTQSNSHVGTNTLLASSKYFISNSQNQGSCKLKYPHKQMEALKLYSENLDKSLHAVLKVRCRLAEKLYTIHRIHETYGKVLCEWATIEKEMGDGLQRAGHYFDALAEFIRPALEDEEVIADQLKEAWYYSSSLGAVTRQYEWRQHQVELYDEKKMEYSKLESGAQSAPGTGNFLLRILGAAPPDSPETREARAVAMRARLRELEASTADAERSRDEFVALVKRDSERFFSTMADDIKDTLRSYVRLQIRIQRKCLNSWTHIRHCVDAIP